MDIIWDAYKYRSIMGNAWQLSGNGDRCCLYQTNARTWFTASRKKELFAFLSHVCSSAQANSSSALSTTLWYSNNMIHCEHISLLAGRCGLQNDAAVFLQERCNPHCDVDVLVVVVFTFSWITGVIVGNVCN